MLPAGLEIEDELLASRAATLPSAGSARYGAFRPKRLEKRDDRVLVFLGTLLLGGDPDAEALLRTNEDGRLADPVALRRAPAAELARRSSELDAHAKSAEP